MKEIRITVEVNDGSEDLKFIWPSNTSTAEILGYLETAKFALLFDESKDN